jgi:hypothetical protein
MNRQLRSLLFPILAGLECGSLLPLSGRKLASGHGAASGRAQSGGKPPHSKQLSPYRGIMHF